LDLSNVLEEGPKSLRTLEAVAAANESIIGGVLGGRISMDKGRVLINGLRLQASVLESIDAAKIRQDIDELRAAVKRIEEERAYVRR